LRQPTGLPDLGVSFQFSFQIVREKIVAELRVEYSEDRRPAFTKLSATLAALLSSIDTLPFFPNIERPFPTLRTTEPFVNAAMIFSLVVIVRSLVSFRLGRGQYCNILSAGQRPTQYIS
jgi:hypothetical protein